MRPAVGSPRPRERASAQGQPGSGLCAGGVLHREAGARGKYPRHCAQKRTAGGKVSSHVIVYKLFQVSSESFHQSRQRTNYNYVKKRVHPLRFYHDVFIHHFKHNNVMKLNEADRI